MKVLVVVDMQNDFTNGVLGNAECEAAVGKVVEVIEKGQYDKIFLTRDTHEENYLSTQEGKKLPVEHCIKNTTGWEVRDEILAVIKEKYNEDDVTFVDKPSFGSLELGGKMKQLADKIVSDGNSLSNLEIDFCGVCTGICVISNVAIMKATLPEVKISVIEEACACVTIESHETAINAMKTFQVDVI